MHAYSALPHDRPAFNSAIGALLSEHKTLRQLAATVSSQTAASAEAAVSLIEAMAAHEQTEAGLFALPFVTRTPKTVTATAARAQQLCAEYITAKSRQTNADAAAARFAAALLEHLSAEEVWLADERAQKQQRLWTSI